MKVNNKYYQLLIDELEAEISRNIDYRGQLQIQSKKSNKPYIDICTDYIKYHQEIIRFIEKFDKKVYEDEKSPSSDN